MDALVSISCRAKLGEQLPKFSKRKARVVQKSGGPGIGSHGGDYKDGACHGDTENAMGYRTLAVAGEKRCKCTAAKSSVGRHKYGENSPLCAVRNSFVPMCLLRKGSLLWSGCH